MVPGEASLRGKQAIRAYLERSARVPGFRISWEPLEAKIAASGDMGYLIERTQVTMNDPSGQPVTQHMKALTVWRKQPDGSWKNVVDMTNPGPAR
jgi:ketosteroid isomerase-like protein